MLNFAQIGIQVSVLQAGSFEPEYQAVLDRGFLLGYSLPSTGQQIKGNQLIYDLKIAGIWDLLDVFYVFAVDGDSDFATLNWKAPSSFQATKVNAPTFTSNQGFNGDASSSYLNTNFNQLNNSVYATPNSSAFVVGVNSTSAAANSKVTFGVRGSSFTHLFTRLSSGSGLATTRNNAASGDRADIPSNSDRIGNYMGTRESSSEIRIYKDGSLGGSDVTSPSSGFLNLNFFICGENQGGSLFNPTDEIITHVGWGNIGAYHSEFNSAWNTYFTSL